MSELRSPVRRSGIASYRRVFHGGIGWPAVETRARLRLNSELRLGRWAISHDSRDQNGECKDGNRNCFHGGRPRLIDGPTMTQPPDRRCDADHTRTLWLGYLETALSTERCAGNRGLNHSACGGLAPGMTITGTESRQFQPCAPLSPPLEAWIAYAPLAQLCRPRKSPASALNG
jgi:hypothetical protein